MGETGSKPFEGNVLQTLKGHSLAVLHCEFSQNGELLATCSADKTILIWNVATGEPVRVLEGHTSDVTCCCFYENVLATCSKDTTVMLWLYESGKRASRLGKDLFCVLFNTNFELSTVTLINRCKRHVLMLTLTATYRNALQFNLSLTSCRNPVDNKYAYCILDY